MGKAHPFQTQFARAIGQGLRVGCRAHGDGLLLQFHHPPQAYRHALHRHVQAQQALHWPYRHAHVGGKGDQRP